MYFAHSTGASDRSDWQPLVEHLRAVAELAKARGDKFGAALAAELAGSLHDLGKYSEAFQRRLEGSPERVDHSTAGF
jgi:CRISPR-associated endonuclease/helicase Cas3